MTDSLNLPPRTTPDDALPPVEPPSAGFIVQLFIIPAVIVAVIVIVWALFNWLAHMGTDPRTYVEALRHDRGNRWQEAHNLATEMNGRNGEALRNDPEVARELSELLESEIKRGDNSDESVKLRYYLCVTLGQFNVPEVLPKLIEAAQPERDERELDVRLAALQGLSQLIPKLTAEYLQQNDALFDTLEKASQDPNKVLRYHAAYTLGVLGGPRALKRLEVLTDDADVDVRMNAAIGLARHGSAAGTDVLLKMLDPADEDVVATEQIEEVKPSKRIAVQLNALEAIEQLHQADPKADFQKLSAAVDRLIASVPPVAVRAKAEEVKGLLARR